MNRRVTRNRFCKNYLTSKNDFWKNHYFHCTMAHFVWTIGWFIGDFSHSITGLNFKESSRDENSSSPIGPIFGSQTQSPIQNVFLRQKESLDVRKPREFPNFIRRYCILPCRLRITRNLLKLRRIHSSGFRFPTHQLSWRKSTFLGKNRLQPPLQCSLLPDGASTPTSNRNREAPAVQSLVQHEFWKRILEWILDSVNCLRVWFLIFQRLITNFNRYPAGDWHANFSHQIT